MRPLSYPPHFKPEELNPFNEPTTPEIEARLLTLAWVLETIRMFIGCPIVITSTYRPPARNKNTTGAATGSYHLDALAVDFIVVGMSMKDVAAKLKDWPGGLGFYSDHIHLDLRTYKSRW